MHVLIDHFGWKVLSLLLAMGLWYAFVGETEVATSVPVLVQYRNIPPDLEITTDQPDRLFLRVRGPASRLSVSALSRTSLWVDLNDVHSPGDQTYFITERELGLPPGVTLLRVVPSQIRVSLERRSSRLVPVEVRYSGAPIAGYRVVSQKVSPEAIRVQGPDQHLRQLKSVITDPVDLSSVVGQAEFRIPVYLSDPHLRLESDDPVSVSIKLEKIPGF